MFEHSKCMSTCVNLENIKWSKNIVFLEIINPSGVYRTNKNLYAQTKENGRNAVNFSLQTHTSNCYFPLNELRFEILVKLKFIASCVSNSLEEQVGYEAMNFERSSIFRATIKPMKIWKAESHEVNLYFMSFEFCQERDILMLKMFSVIKAEMCVQLSSTITILDIYFTPSYKLGFYVDSEFTERKGLL